MDAVDVQGTVAEASFLGSAVVVGIADVESAMLATVFPARSELHGADEACAHYLAFSCHVPSTVV